jgi:hypothetical protein
MPSKSQKSVTSQKDQFVVSVMYGEGGFSQGNYGISNSDMPAL